MMQNKVIDLWGEPIEAAISSAATNHASCTVIQTSPPSGTTVHTHTREDEVLVVLEGRYAFYNGQAWLHIHPGEPFSGVRGRPHAYRNVGTVLGRMLVVATPGGLDEYFEAISSLSLPGDQARFDDISRMYGITVLPPGAVPELG